MSKCIKCGNLFIDNPQDSEMCHICKIADLEAKLAEKDEEIENINKEWVQSIHDWKEIVKKKDEEIAQLEEHDMIFHNQLAVEKLEKVRELIKNMSIGIGIEIYGTRIKPVEEYIDNQIEELKKGRD